MDSTFSGDDRKSEDLPSQTPLSVEHHEVETYMLPSPLEPDLLDGAIRMDSFCKTKGQEQEAETPPTPPGDIMRDGQGYPMFPARLRTSYELGLGKTTNARPVSSTVRSLEEVPEATTSTHWYSLSGPRFRQDIDTESWLTDLSLYLICFSSATERFLTKWHFDYQIFGLTGNLAELLAPQTTFQPSLACSVVSWMLGCHFHGQLANAMDSKLKRGWLLASMSAQLCLMLLAMMVSRYPFQSSVVGEDTSFIAMSALLSLASGMTFAMLKQLKIPEINAALMTGVVGNFLSCEQFYTRRLDRTRIRYLLSIAVFVAGYKVASAMDTAAVEARLIWLLVLLPRGPAIVLLFFIRGKRADGLKSFKDIV
ncbi:hypothetical protein BDV97DRAFT_373441 [Delphinella strobiligena]|nr:hypothetical protein BDV97DRAFT_373441 [Delphinella strobiligena]